MSDTDDLPEHRVNTHSKDSAGLERIEETRRFSLPSRILAVNILPLALLGGGIFYLDTYREQLLAERFKLARIEAQITAEALAGANRSRQEALMIQIGKEQSLRLRMYDNKGNLQADSFELDEPAFVLDVEGDENWEERFARLMDRSVNKIVGAQEIPDYVEPEDTTAEAWPELREARAEERTQIRLRDWHDGTAVINAAAPVGLHGATLLTTRNPVDITQSVRQARSTLLTYFIIALLMSVTLSMFLSSTIVSPLRSLSRAAMRVRLGRDRQVEVPRLPDRRDEIGVLARAVSDMSVALRQRIDAVEYFAADVAHEIKNPLASLRSAIESLGRVEDPELRNQLTNIAAHDVRRIDRLVTEISDASRIEAEMSRATLERVDLGALVASIIGSRAYRDENQKNQITVSVNGAAPIVMGMPVRLERIVENLLDNAVSFSPPEGEITINLENDGERVTLIVCDEGPGIPPAAREKVFNRFHSVRPDTEEFGNHSGLGLAIARTIAEAHDGWLTARDRPDGKPGACLVLDLPAAPQDTH